MDNCTFRDLKPATKFYYLGIEYIKLKDCWFYGCGRELESNANAVNLNTGEFAWFYGVLGVKKL